MNFGLSRLLFLGSWCSFMIMPLGLQAQSEPKVLKLAEAYALAVQYSVQLKIAGKSAERAKQQTEIAKLYRLPGVRTELNYGYISNADIWTPSFTEHQKGAIPHQFTQFTVQAAQVVFKGHEVRNEIHRSTLEEKIAELSVEQNAQDIKLMVAAKYLDIYRLVNQHQVLLNNIRLAQQRLKNIMAMRRQGMVTQNDVLRTELIISDLQLAANKTVNQNLILRKQLSIITGLPDSAAWLPDTALLGGAENEESLAQYREKAYRENHELKISSLENQVSEAKIKISQAERIPEIVLFAGSSLQRPFLNTIPSVDIFYNVWQAGVGVRYNISSIYQSPRRIKAARIESERTALNGTHVKEEVDVAVTTYFIKYNEAKDELLTLKKDRLSAVENYRIAEKRYFNQLALLTDLTDATNTKLEAELKVTNAEINVIYTYCQLLHIIGTL